MRLGQLARKVSVLPSEIVEFLAKNGVVIEEGTNTRVTDPDTELVIRKYAPHLLIPVSQPELAIVESQPTESIAPEIIAPDSDLLTAAVQASEEALELKENEESAVETTDGPELIKATKVELKGLKVVGKIDLPEPKKKENVEEVLTSEPTVVAPLADQKRKNRNRDFPKQQSRGPNKNPVALERERLERETEERKLRKAEEEKERRKNYYAKRVKPSAPTRSVKIIDDAVSTMEEEAKEPPKGLLGKFLHWLTS